MQQICGKEQQCAGPEISAAKTTPRHPAFGCKRTCGEGGRFEKELSSNVSYRKSHRKVDTTMIHGFLPACDSGRYVKNI